MNERSDCMQVRLPYGDGELALQVPQRNLLAVLTPRAPKVCADAGAEVRRALEQPVAAPRLRLAARGARRAVILADDMTRQTPVRTILPLVLEELNAAGLDDAQITILIALGTHRPMTAEEIEARCGRGVTQRVTVVNSPWQDPGQLADLGRTPAGTPVHVARLAVEADFLLGLGTIVPHHIPGFSAGAKIVQPGICAAETTGATHLLSARLPRCLGQVENPVRAELEAIAGRVGLQLVLNTVLDPEGRLVRAVYGDLKEAFRAGVEAAKEVYGVRLPGLADVAVAGSHPCDIEFWQAHKALYPADLAVRPGGTIILVTPCPEGVAVTHPDLLEFGALGRDEIFRQVDRGRIQDAVAASLAIAIAKVRDRAQVSLVSEGITAAEAQGLGFTPFSSVEEALEAALQRHGTDAQVSVLTHSPDTLPLT